MKHLQAECVFHLSALAAGAILALQTERAELEEAMEKIKEQDEILKIHRSNW